MAQFAGSAHWAEPSPQFAYRRHSTSLNCKNEYLVLALGEKTTVEQPCVCRGDGQTEAYLKDMGMTGLVVAWAMARRRTKKYRMLHTWSDLSKPLISHIEEVNNPRIWRQSHYKIKLISSHAWGTAKSFLLYQWFTVCMIKGWSCSLSYSWWSDE